MKIKVAVGCHGYDGPDLFFVVVECSQEQYDNGEHYVAAQEVVTENNEVDGPFWCVDENDPAKAVLGLCGFWETALEVWIG